MLVLYEFKDSAVDVASSQTSKPRLKKENSLGDGGVAQVVLCLPSLHRRIGTHK